MNSQKKRRFIAGAVCPHCQAEDTLALMIDAQQAEQVICVACGEPFSLDKTPSSPSSQLIARFPLKQ